MGSVVDTPELLEAVLLQLDMRTLLVSAQLVCGKWHALIENSPSIQRALFFKPEQLPAGEKGGKNNRERKKINPLLAEVFGPFFQGANGERYERGCGDLDIRSLPIGRKRDAYFFKRASWKRMLVQQPPALCLGKISDTTAVDSLRFHLHLSVLKCSSSNNADGNGARNDEETNETRGLRMGVLYHEVFKALNALAACSFWMLWSDVPSSLLAQYDARSEAPRNLMLDAVERYDVVLYFRQTGSLTREVWDREKSWSRDFKCEEYASRPVNIKGLAISDCGREGLGSAGLNESDNDYFST